MGVVNRCRKGLRAATNVDNGAYRERGLIVYPVRQGVKSDARSSYHDEECEEDWPGGSL